MANTGVEVIVSHLERVQAEIDARDAQAAAQAYNEAIHPMEREYFPQDILLSMIKRGIHLSRHPELLQEGGSQ